LLQNLQIQTVNKAENQFFKNFTLVFGHILIIMCVNRENFPISPLMQALVTPKQASSVPSQNLPLLETTVCNKLPNWHSLFCIPHRLTSARHNSSNGFLSFEKVQKIGQQSSLLGKYEGLEKMTAVTGIRQDNTTIPVETIKQFSVATQLNESAVKSA
jgi:hypothetical protein